MKRFHLIWPLVALSLALAVLSGFAAVGLVREQRDAAADLRTDVEQHRSVAELEECFIELIALVKDRVRKVSAIHERADSLYSTRKADSPLPPTASNWLALMWPFISIWGSGTLCPPGRSRLMMASFRSWSM